MWLITILSAKTFILFSIHLAVCWVHTSTACLLIFWQCQRPTWSPGRQYPLLLSWPPGEKFNYRSLSKFVKHDFPLIKPCLILLMIFLSLIFHISCSIILVILNKIILSINNLNKMIVKSYNKWLMQYIFLLKLSFYNQMHDNTIILMEGPVILWKIIGIKPINQTATFP